MTGRSQVSNATSALYTKSGFWSSPVHVEMLTTASRLLSAAFDHDGRTLVWSESHDGRTTLWCRHGTHDAPRCLTPDHNVRGEIGYGGGEFTVAKGFAYFIAENRIWKIGVSENICREPRYRIAQPITPAMGGAWSSPTVSPDGRWLVAIHEDEREQTRLVVVDTEGCGWPKILVEGWDFLMQPRFDPSGQALVWVAWHHPDMPWNAAELWIAPWITPTGTPQCGKKTGTAKLASSESRELAGSENLSRNSGTTVNSVEWKNGTDTRETPVEESEDSTTSGGDERSIEKLIANAGTASQGRFAANVCVEMPRIGLAKRIAGGFLPEENREIAIFQPEFLPDSRLIYISDETGFGRIVVRHQTVAELCDPSIPLDRRTENSSQSAFVTPQTADELFQAAWIQDMRRMSVLPDGSLAVVVDRGGIQTLCRWNFETQQLLEMSEFSEYQEFTTIATPPVVAGPSNNAPIANMMVSSVTAVTSGTEISSNAVLETADLTQRKPRGMRLAVVASGARIPPRLLAWHAMASEAVENVGIVVRSSSESVAPAALAPAMPVSWTNEGGTEIHGILWTPVSWERGVAASDFERIPQDPDGSRRKVANAVSEETVSTVVKPPLLVLVHGGPTSHTTTGWNATAQYFATRGWAVLAVNYRGSTGFGRIYRDALCGNWGVVDREDIVSGVEYLSETLGRIDSRRVVILGGSAGGYTALRVLLESPEHFAAGIVSYPVTDLFPSADGEPKFERYYFEWLVGKLPEAEAIYRTRSPRWSNKLFRTPIALFHGSCDPVVPVGQSEALAAKMERDGIPYRFHIYEGESHGFRRTEHLNHYWKTIESFLREVLVR